MLLRNVTYAVELFTDIKQIQIYQDWNKNATAAKTNLYNFKSSFK